MAACLLAACLLLVVSGLLILFADRVEEWPHRLGVAGIAVAIMVLTVVLAVVAMKRM